MKTKKSNVKILNSKLAAYSATATAALLVAPVAHATIQDITGLSLNLNLPGSQSFSAGGFSGSFNGTHGSMKQQVMTPGFTTPGFPGMPGHFSGPYNSIYLPSTPGFPGQHFPGHLITVGTYWHGKANINGNVAGVSNASNLAKGIAFTGLNFFNGQHLLAYRTNHLHQSGAFNGNSGYLAFKAGSYYGWLKVKVSLGGNNAPDEIQLVDNGDGIYGAFDKISDTSADGFKVGSVATEPVPEPSVAAIGGLGLLALGAAGVRELRRRRKQEAKN